MGEAFLENTKIYENTIGGAAVFGVLNAKNSIFKKNKLASSCSLRCKNGKCGRLGKMLNNEIEGGQCVK